MVCAAQQLSDRELIERIQSDSLDSPLTEPYRATLFLRYEKLVHNMKLKLMQCNRFVDPADYYGDSYEVFLKAVRNVNLAKVTNPDWKFWIVFYGYLRAYNRDHGQRAIVLSVNEIASADNMWEALGELERISFREETTPWFSTSAEHVFDEFSSKDFWEAISRCMNEKLTDSQKTILQLRGCEGEKVTVLKQKLGLTHTQYMNEVSNIRDILREELGRNPIFFTHEFGCYN